MQAKMRFDDAEIAAVYRAIFERRDMRHFKPGNVEAETLNVCCALRTTRQASVSCSPGELSISLTQRCASRCMTWWNESAGPPRRRSANAATNYASESGGDTGMRRAARCRDDGWPR